MRSPLSFLAAVALLSLPLTLVCGRIQGLPTEIAPKSRVLVVIPFSQSHMYQLTPGLMELAVRGHHIFWTGDDRVFKANAMISGFTWVDPPAGIHPFHNPYHTDQYVAATRAMQASDVKGDARKDYRHAAASIASFLSHGCEGYAANYHALDAVVAAVHPDLVVTDFYGLFAIDYCKHRNMKYALLHSHPIGFFAGFGDTWAAPDPLVGQGTHAHISSFKNRLLKALGTPLVLHHTRALTKRLNAERRKLGVPQDGLPSTNMYGANVISTWSWGLDVPRRISPLVHMVGLPKASFDTSQVVRLPKDQQDLWAWLDHFTGRGLVYVSFGAEVFPTAEELGKLVAGARSFARPLSYEVLVVLRRHAQKLLGADVVSSLIPANSGVHLLEWVNQEMVLAHHAVKVFITHGGLGGIAEGVMNLVPMLVVPYAGEQPANAQRVEEAGVGLRINHLMFTQEEVESKLQRLVSEQHFQDALVKHWRINAAGGGYARRAADALELQLAVGVEHLVPVEEKVPLYVAWGLDVLGLLAAAKVALGWLALRGARLVLLPLLSYCRHKRRVIDLKKIS